jgi:IS6 family transposase
MYLYRAVDSHGQTLEFLLSLTRDAAAAKQFFQKTLEAVHTVAPRVITVDKNAAYPKAQSELKSEGAVPPACELRLLKYLNNLIEQDHRFIKRVVKPGLLNVNNKFPAMVIPAAVVGHIPERPPFASSDCLSCWAARAR